MSDHPHETLPLDQAVERWARKLRATSGWTVETILATSEKLLAALQELSPHGAKARVMLAREARLSRSMMSKLEQIGHHAGMLRPAAANLPPYVSSLYALTQKPFAQFKQALAIDLRGLSRIEIARLFGKAPVSSAAHRKLISVRAPAELAPETRRALLADIHTAMVAISAARGIDLVLSPRARPRAKGRGRSRRQRPETAVPSRPEAGFPSPVANG